MSEIGKLKLSLEECMRFRFFVKDKLKDKINLIKRTLEQKTRNTSCDDIWILH